MQMISVKLCALVLALGVSACGDTIAEQAVLGGAAGVGAAAVTGGPILTGAAIGAAGNVAYCQLTGSNCR